MLNRMPRAASPTISRLRKRNALGDRVAALDEPTLQCARSLLTVPGQLRGVDPFFRTELKAMPQQAAECKTQNVPG